MRPGYGGFEEQEIIVEYLFHFLWTKFRTLLFLNAKVMQQAAGIRREFDDTIGPRSHLDVASTNEQAAGTAHLAVSTQRQIGGSAADIQIEKPAFRASARQGRTTPHERQPGFQAGIIGAGDK